MFVNALYDYPCPSEFLKSTKFKGIYIIHFIEYDYCKYNIFYIKLYMIIIPTKNIFTTKQMLQRDVYFFFFRNPDNFDSSWVVQI